MRAVGVIIIREMVGTSPQSWSDAARQAVATASKTVRNIQTVEVVKSSAVVEDGQIVEYRVEVKIGFEYEGLTGGALPGRAGLSQPPRSVRPRSSRSASASS